LASKAAERIVSLKTISKHIFGNCLLQYLITSFFFFSIFDPDTHVPVEEKRLATWGTEVPEDLILDPKRLTEAIKKVLL